MPITKQWVTAYYAGYLWDWTGSQPADAIAAVDFSTLTHLVFAHYAAGGGTLGGAPGSLMPGAGTGHAAVEALLLEHAHGAGCKALMMVGGEGEGPGWDASTGDPGTRATLVANLVATAASLGYDGFDIDWEENLDTPAQQAQAVALLTELRAAADLDPAFQPPHGPAVLTWPGFSTNINYATVTPWHVQIASLVDQYNLMTYAMAGSWEGWESWHHAALAGASPNYPTSVEASVAEYMAAGVPAAKLGIGIGLYGLTYGSPITGPRQGLTGMRGSIGSDDLQNNTRQLRLEGAFTYPGGSYNWDSAAQHSYYAYTPTWSRASGEEVSYLSYEGERSIGAKGAWARAHGLGGVIVWTLNYGLDGKSNPMMEAVKNAVLV